MKNSLADKIREARKGKGITQQTLAERAGVAISTVSLIERGEHKPTLETLSKICHVLGLEIGVR